MDFSRDDVELLIQAGNISGSLEGQKAISIEDDFRLAEFIIQKFIEYRALAWKYFNFVDFMEYSLLMEYGNKED